MSINPFENYPLTWRPRKDQLTRPFYQSLVDQMKVDIKKGKLLPGTKLPPQRELADYLDVSFSTITRAYQLSQKQGLTYGRVGQGTFIAGNVNSPLVISRQGSTDQVAELGFVASFESTNRLATKTIKAVANESQLTALLNYESPTGLASHKAAATRYLNRIGMGANPQNTVITSGGENGLVIALFSLFQPGDRIAVDQFTYANLIKIAHLHQLTLVPIAGDQNGMKPEALRQICQNQLIRGIYLMPDYTNPTCITMPEQRRHDLAAIIRQFQLILIEDDYLSFLNLFRYQPLTKLSSLLPNQSVYIASMSKPLVSGLRIGFMRFSDQFKDRLQPAIFSLNVKTSSLDAEIVTRLLENGQGNKIMLEKVHLMRQANKIYNQVFGIKSGPTGFFRCLPINCPLAGPQVDQFFINHQLRVFHSERFAVGRNAGRHFLRVALAAIDDPNELRTQLVKLKDLLEKQGWI